PVEETPLPAPRRLQSYLDHGLIIDFLFPNRIITRSSALSIDPEVDRISRGYTANDVVWVTDDVTRRDVPFENKLVIVENPGHDAVCAGCRVTVAHPYLSKNPDFAR